MKDKTRQPWSMGFEIGICVLLSQIQILKLFHITIIMSQNITQFDEEKANHYQEDFSLLINYFELFVNEQYHQRHTFVYLVTQ